MEHIAALLLIVGCSGNLDQCRELPAPSPIFETVEDCKVQRPLSLADVQGKKPRVFAECVSVDPAMEEEDAVLDWSVTKDGRLEASITAGDDMIVAYSPSRDRETVRQQ